VTTRPQLRTGKSQAIGVLAVALFGLMALTFLTADFGAAEGFGGATGITAAIGRAMFNLAPEQASVPSEGFLIPFEIIDVVLVAALAAAVMLARREEGREGFLPLTDGGRPEDEDGPDPGARDADDDGGER
jgi:NADH-quinone oxidoreductase subunit J